MANAPSLRSDAYAFKQLALALIDHPASERFARMAKQLFAQAEGGSAAASETQALDPGVTRSK